MIVALLIILIVVYLSISRENLDAHIRVYYGDGYRTSIPGTSQCLDSSECEKNERCQGGYCETIILR